MRKLKPGCECGCNLTPPTTIHVEFDEEFEMEVRFDYTAEQPKTGEVAE